MENITSHDNSSILIDQHSLAILENSTLQFSDIDFFTGNFDFDFNFDGEMWRMSENSDGLLFGGDEEWRENSWLLEENGEDMSLQSFLSDYINIVNSNNIDEGDYALPPNSSQGSYTRQNGRVETKVDTFSKEEEEETMAKEGEQVIGFIVKSQVDMLDDGYCWRKYGEKNIKKRIYPRSYYRCSYHGCGTLKRVERSTEESSKLLITYYGRHNHHPYY